MPLETAVEAIGENEDTGGQWGLEDYVVEVNGFECLHFMSVDGLLREGDEVVYVTLSLISFPNVMVLVTDLLILGFAH